MDVTMMSIGTVRTPFGKTTEIPKGQDAKHDAEGIIEIGPAFEAGLQDIEGFSHLYVLDGTPVLDIKPYLSSIPAGEIRRGWLAEAEERRRLSTG